MTAVEGRPYCRWSDREMTRPMVLSREKQIRQLDREMRRWTDLTLWKRELPEIDDHLESSLTATDPDG